MNMGLDLASMLLLVVIIILIGVIGLAVYFYLKFRESVKQQQEMETRFQEMKSQVHPLQLETLEAKLNPHLFKNILNSIQSHAYQTYFAIDKLANVLDYILYESRKEFVTPKEEIEFAKNLIEINKIKVSPLFDLKVKTKVNNAEPLYEQKLLAPLISIDLIENAFKHADIQSPDSFISITMEFKDNHFGLTVANKISSKPPMKKEKGGIGIKTLEKRLQIIYEDNFKLDSYIEDNVYVAHLNIDLFEYKIKVLAAR
jgi:LytS/YehU family sensor histidine kinase